MLARLLLVLVIGWGLLFSSCCPKKETPTETPGVEEETMPGEGATPEEVAPPEEGTETLEEGETPKE